MKRASGRLLLGAVLAAGSLGAVLALAGVRTPVRPVLVLVFLLVVPTVAIAGLLPGFDRLARVVLAATADVVVLLLTATVMVALGAWSPRWGVVVMGVVSVACFAVPRLPAVRRPGTLAGRWSEPDGAPPPLEPSAR